VAKKKSPAYQWYPKDALTDDAIIQMSFEVEGFYRYCLDMCWLSDGLPADDDDRFRLLQKCKKRSEFDRLWRAVSDRFFVGRGGKLRNKRQEQERTKQKKFSKSRKESAKKRWDRAREKDDARASARASNLVSDSQCFAFAFPSADQDQEPEVPRADRAPRAMARMSMAEARPHLQAAAHLHLDAYPDATDGDVREAVKTAAAKLTVEYDGRGVATIVDGVLGRRARRLA
jgi:uncharacterized protein YdaU (DUF1376 family)